MKAESDRTSCRGDTLIGSGTEKGGVRLEKYRRKGSDWLNQTDKGGVRQDLRQRRHSDWI